jgi:hypothetical protein
MNSIEKKRGYYLGTEIEGFDPHAPCLRDHPVSGVPTLREDDTVLQQPESNSFNADWHSCCISLPFG